MIRLRTVEVATRPAGSELPEVRDPGSVAQLVARAEAALAAGRWREAYQRYTDAMVIERRTRDAVGLAVAAHEFDEPEDAVAALELGLDDEPRDVDLLLDLATLALRFDQPALALRAARRAVEVGGAAHAEAAAMLRRVQETKAARGKSKAAAVKRLLADLQAPDDALRAMACDALADAGAAGAVPAIERVLAGDPSPRVRAAAARALGVLGSPEAAAALARAAGDGGAEVRAAVAWALGARIDPAARAPLEALARDADAAVRAAAARALEGLAGGEE